MDGGGGGGRNRNSKISDVEERHPLKGSKQNAFGVGNPVN